MIRRPEPRVFRQARIALAWTLGLLAAAGAASAEGWSFRYGFAPEQRWNATQTITRSTEFLGEREESRGSATFRYAIGASEIPGHVELEARMLGQTTAAGESPFDFSAIRFLALSDTRGVFRGIRFEIGDVEPPEMPEIERDPVAFREMLRRIAAAWSDSVFWLPTLPEEPLALGESFVLSEREDVPGTDPGVAMEITSKRTYTLESVEGDVARFAITLTSTVDAATARSNVESQRRAEGEALFDRRLGMWTLQEIRSEERARFEGGPGGTGRASAATVTRIEMAPAKP